MSTVKKYKKDRRTSTILIIVFALAFIGTLLLPYLAGIKEMVDSAFLAPDVYIQLDAIAQTDTYQQSYNNALLLGSVIKQFYLAFALQFLLLLVLTAWVKVLLRRYAKTATAPVVNESA